MKKHVSSPQERWCFNPKVSTKSHFTSIKIDVPLTWKRSCTTFAKEKSNVHTLWEKFLSALEDHTPIFVLLSLSLVKKLCVLSREKDKNFLREKYSIIRAFIHSLQGSLGWKFVSWFFRFVYCFNSLVFKELWLIFSRVYTENCRPCVRSGCTCMLQVF